jgi:hypothetical protein
MNIAFTAADIAKWIAFGPVRVRSIHGFNNQSTDLYVQLHEISKGTVSSTQVQPANGTVPKFKSLHVQAGNSFKWEFEDGIVFSELVVAISTTEANLTIVGASGGVDLTLVADGDFMVDNYPTLTVFGDLTSLVNGQGPWLSADGPHTLARLTAIGNASVDHFLVGYAEDSPSPTSKILFGLPCPKLTTVDYSFGSGFVPFAQTAGFVANNGCTINSAVDLTPGGLDSTNHIKCRVIYF